ncbi:cytochrome c biogenesis protein CcmA [Salmonella enterica subsp. arizonae]|uniref:Cytochrome c biogenesis protein CcmA n=1 Tax=Salmonella enterica subsp. arizonae TaxID=59203 RepID=A0A379RWR2_SALER|nr:cytochrome c biogenesis protein CcmA [Salmonella enterica subsp. arizonae]
MTMMLEARELHCERDERTLFRGLSFTVDAGEWVQITGGNGAGKTTLLRLLTGLARPDGGEVYWRGEPLRRVRDSYHQDLLWTGHQPGIKTRLTAQENLRFFHQDGDTAQCLEALAQAGLADMKIFPLISSQPDSSAAWRWPACGSPARPSGSSTNLLPLSM